MGDSAPPAERESPWSYFWAKTPRDSDDRRRETRRYHPLLYHMLDVAAVADAIWRSCLSQTLRKRLEAALGDDAHTHIIFLAGAHDLGKASPAFQKRSPELSDALENAGFRFSKYDRRASHGFISTRILDEMFEDFSEFALLHRITGGHHGTLPRASDLEMGRTTLGNDHWKEARRALLEEFAITVGFDLQRKAGFQRKISDPSIIPILAGFICISDWIGSNQEYFKCTVEYGSPAPRDTERYWDKAQEKAHEALTDLGWLPAVAFSEEKPFDAIFEGFTPNALQRATIELALKQTSPYLMIIEAPMGQGKTEAALFAADVSMCRGFASGMYIAMPTQATSNAMFKRVLDDYLSRRGHRGKLNLQLVHADALLTRATMAALGEVGEFKPENISEGGDAEAQSWFGARKRPLLAPFGVGTIDQSLLSVLQTRHWFVRLFGLADKVIIFDEVHAYDAYMSTILERLMGWLAEVGCTVIVLSATLPEAKRRALVKAYSSQEDIAYERYPRITLAEPRLYGEEQAENEASCIEITMDEPRTIEIDFIGTELAGLAETLAQRLKTGGCAAVVCNTVDRAIEVYRYLAGSMEDTECGLFHARTLQAWRRKREEEVLRKFGKGERQPDGTYVNQHRPERAVLVATQVIEQSLDLDFDLMVSEIAPIDLLLQRCGRLHRHPRPRPANLRSPRFIVICDADLEGKPPDSFGKGIEYIYERFILLRTWLALRQRTTIDLPMEIEGLVEAAYGVCDSAHGDDWKHALEQAHIIMEHGRSESGREAGRILISAPASPSDLIEVFNDQLLEDEDPMVHRTLRASTREGNPSITVVMVPAKTALSDEPDVLEVRSLLEHSVKLSAYGLFKALLEEGERPREWAGNAHLRHARIARLDQNNSACVGGYSLTADEALGVVSEKDGGDNG